MRARYRHERARCIVEILELRLSDLARLILRTASAALRAASYRSVNRPSVSTPSMDALSR
jgi:hypothetical protein